MVKYLELHIYALSGSGWITATIFDDWFHNHFLCYSLVVRPILLLLDGHSSYYNPSVIESAVEEVASDHILSIS